MRWPWQDASLNREAAANLVNAGLGFEDKHVPRQLHLIFHPSELFTRSFCTRPEKPQVARALLNYMSKKKKSS